MKLLDIAKNLANRINQEHYIVHELKKVFDTAYKLGFEEANKQNQSLQLQQAGVMPRLFYVVARNSEENLEQITQGLDTYEKAKHFKNSDFCKKRFEYAFIICTINEA